MSKDNPPVGEASNGSFVRRVAVCRKRVSSNFFGACCKKTKKMRLTLDLRLWPSVPGPSHTTTGYEKTYAHLNSVLEQARVTTAVVEAPR